MRARERSGTFLFVGRNAVAAAGDDGLHAKQVADVARTEVCPAAGTLTQFEAIAVAGRLV